eukprot:TRINITY_DN3047_c0_g1_i1.p1 TRINITY_DN3047_c0_g1~~TRINITY_DN3047_c0_g1_i1.p1  ORF type:complete len:341 (-),score=92.19 TRINITY_DN3047_c0_g1_i1:33-1055(-)
MATVIDKIRSSCLFVSENAPLVKIDEEAVDRFVQQLDYERFQSVSRPVGLPLRFDNTAQEINFHTLINMLNFGSGFRKELHQACDRGAYETMLFGVMSMHISQFELSASNLKTISRASIIDFFRIPYTHEVEKSPGIYLSQPTALAPLVDMILHVLNECGELLEKYRYRDFSQFVIESCKEKSAVLLTERLVKAFPTFDDRFTWKGQEIFIYKKAQLVAAELYRHLKDKDPLMNFVDMNKLTVFSDNVVPAILRHYGILSVEETLLKKIEDGVDLPCGDEDLQLRACAIVACEQITKKLQLRFPDRSIDESDVDYFLWLVAKEPDLRKVQRHATKDTHYY